MKKLLRLILSWWRVLWQSWLRLALLPWRWMSALMGAWLGSLLGCRKAPPPSPRESPSDGSVGGSSVRQSGAHAPPTADQPPADISVVADSGAPPHIDARPTAQTPERQLAPASAPSTEPTAAPIDEPAAEPAAEQIAEPIAKPDLAPGPETATRSSSVAGRSIAVRAAEPPASVGPSGEFGEGTFENHAGERGYKLYRPAGKPPGPLPLVVMLHGCKQDPADFALGTRMNQLADRHGVLVLYPAQPKSANSYACWNWFSKRDQERDAGEPAILAGMVRDMIERHSADPARVFAAGLSAGGAMVAILAHTHPDLLAAAGIHSGLPYRAAQDVIGALGVMKRGATTRAAPPARPRAATPGARARAMVPLIVFHGDHDKTVHPINGERVVEQALESTRAARPHDLGHSVVKPGRVPGGHAYTRTIHSDRAGHVHAEHWLVQGSGHAWSGGDSAGSFTDPLGPDASAEMLRFFLERARA